ncbi:MAG: exodeoxyribonuclease V, partial [Solirubrobacterales bacterium]|nr:exodeoxyribonuclease V [Solirubrobacterales bacterium]
MAIESSSGAFAAFCTAGLWPGCGTKLAQRVVAAGITHPDAVTPGMLAELDGVSERRARRLVDALDKARPVFDAAEMLHAADAEVRLAAAAVRQ